MAGSETHFYQFTQRWLCCGGNVLLAAGRVPKTGSRNQWEGNCDRGQAPNSRPGSESRLQLSSEQACHKSLDSSEALLSHPLFLKPGILQSRHHSAPSTEERARAQRFACSFPVCRVFQVRQCPAKPTLRGYGWNMQTCQGRLRKYCR